MSFEKQSWVNQCQEWKNKWPVYQDVFSEDLDGINIYAVIEALNKNTNSNDVFIPISTSGKSKNILLAVDVALSSGITVFGLTGESGGELATKCESIKIPSGRTERIQEGHILVGHVLCSLIEDGYFKKS